MHYRIYGYKEMGYKLLKKVLTEEKLNNFVSSLNLEKYYSILIIRHDDKLNMDDSYFYDNCYNDIINDLKELNSEISSRNRIYLSSLEFFQLFLAFMCVRENIKIYLSNIGFILYKYLLDNEYVDLLSDFDIDDEYPSLKIAKIIKKLIKSNYLKKINNELYLVTITKEEAGKIINSYDNATIIKMYDLVNMYQDELALQLVNPYLNEAILQKIIDLSRN